MLQGAWDWLADIERDHKVMVRYEIVPTANKYQFNVAALAEVAVRGGGMHLIAKVSQRFPSGQARSFVGLLVELSVKLDKLVEETALDRVGLTIEAPPQG